MTFQTVLSALSNFSIIVDRGLRSVGIILDRSQLSRQNGRASLVYVKLIVLHQPSL